MNGRPHILVRVGRLEFPRTSRNRDVRRPLRGGPTAPAGLNLRKRVGGLLAGRCEPHPPVEAIAAAEVHGEMHVDEMLEVLSDPTVERVGVDPLRRDGRGDPLDRRLP
jgi:hypothetical protein